MSLMKNNLVIGLVLLTLIILPSFKEHKLTRTRYYDKINLKSIEVFPQNSANFFT